MGEAWRKWNDNCRNTRKLNTLTFIRPGKIKLVYSLLSDYYFVVNSYWLSIVSHNAVLMFPQLKSTLIVCSIVKRKEIHCFLCLSALLHTRKFLCQLPITIQPKTPLGLQNSDLVLVELVIWRSKSFYDSYSPQMHWAGKRFVRSRILE